MSFGATVLLAGAAAACSDSTTATDAGSIADAAVVPNPDPVPVEGGVADVGGPPRPDAATDAADAADAADSAAKPPLAFVFAGESNSGGIALNSEATPAELAPRPSVQIMNLYSGTFAFEPLDIGFNNLVDHAGLSTVPAYVPVPPNTILIHGMELGLANAVEGGALDASSVYLIKTGQGGSKIAEWGVGGAYWTKFLERTNAAKAKLPPNTRWVVWYSQGINDAIASVPIATWKAATVDHLQKIKTQLPGSRIILTEFQSMPANGGYPAVNAAIEEIVRADPTLAAVPSMGAGTDGANHWSYAGFRNTVVPALVRKSVIN